jgi:hypothetical protein
MKRKFAAITILVAMFCGLTAVAFVGCTAGQLNGPTAALGGTTQPTTQAAGAALVQTAATDAAAVAPAFGPWGIFASAVLTVIASVASVYAKNQNGQKVTAQAIIASAAPGVAQLVSQVTDNQTLASDVTTIAAVAPAVIDLIQHPSATAAIAATPGVSQAVQALASGASQPVASTVAAVANAKPPVT